MAIPVPGLACGAASADDVRDFERGVRLAMASLSPEVLPAFELEDNDLRAEALADDLRFDLRAADQRLAELHGLARHEEHVVEGDGGADGSGGLSRPGVGPRGPPGLFPRPFGPPLTFLHPSPDTRPSQGPAAGSLSRTA